MMSHFGCVNYLHPFIVRALIAVFFHSDGVVLTKSSICTPTLRSTVCFIILSFRRWALNIEADAVASLGLILNGSSVHGGLRSRLLGWEDYEDDTRQGFLQISADDIDDLGTRGIIDMILERMGTRVPVYLSVDIDVIDPGLCPGTGTPEAGGWTSRELIRILRGIEDLNIVGADIVEVAPAYDGTGEQTALVASQIGYEILTSIVARGLAEKDRMDNKESHQSAAKQRDEL